MLLTDYILIYFYCPLPKYLDTLLYKNLVINCWSKSILNTLFPMKFFFLISNLYLHELKKKIGYSVAIPPKAPESNSYYFIPQLLH